MVDVEGELRLRSLLYPSIWHPREEAVARCRRSLAYLPWGRMPLHEAPAVDCVCGIYGGREAGQARLFLALPVDDAVVYRVLGSMAMWGRVVEAELGWRSERAYPHELYVPRWDRGARLGWRRRRLRADEVAGGLEAYGVPVEVADTPPAGEAPPRLAA